MSLMPAQPSYLNHLSLCDNGKALSVGRLDQTKQGNGLEYRWVLNPLFTMQKQGESVLPGFETLIAAGGPPPPPLASGRLEPKFSLFGIRSSRTNVFNHISAIKDNQLKLTRG